VPKFESHAFYHAMIEAMGKRGCALCRMIADASHRFLDAVLYDSVTAVGFRKTFRAARGFCPRHTRELAGFANAVGTSILEREVIADALDRLQGAAARGKVKPAAERCQACVAEEQVARNFADSVEGHIEDGAFLGAWRASEGLCVPHLEGLMAKAPGTVRRVILEIEGPKMEALVGRLDEFLRKSDYRFAHEPKGEEGKAWLDAVRKAAGGACADK
jgi:hypothetical protein